MEIDYYNETINSVVKSIRPRLAAIAFAVTMLIGDCALPLAQILYSGLRPDHLSGPEMNMAGKKSL